MTDPRSAVICRTTGWNDEDDDDAHYVALILAALDIHAAAELARQREGCVKVRAAVASNDDGGMMIYGELGQTDEQMDEHMALCDFNPPFGFLTGWVRPPVPVEIDGEVEHD